MYERHTPLNKAHVKALLNIYQYLLVWIYSKNQSESCGWVHKHFSAISSVR